MCKGPCVSLLPWSEVCGAKGSLPVGRGLPPPIAHADGLQCSKSLWGLILPGFSPHPCPRAGSYGSSRAPSRGKHRHLQEGLTTHTGEVCWGVLPGRLGGWFVAHGCTLRPYLSLVCVLRGHLHSVPAETCPV